MHPWLGANGLVVKYSFAITMESSCAGGSIPPWRIFYCAFSALISTPRTVQANVRLPNRSNVHLFENVTILLCRRSRYRRKLGVYMPSRFSSADFHRQRIPSNKYECDTQFSKLILATNQSFVTKDKYTR